MTLFVTPNRLNQPVLGTHADEQVGLMSDPSALPESFVATLKAAQDSIDVEFTGFGIRWATSQTVLAQIVRLLEGFNLSPRFIFEDTIGGSAEIPSESDSLNNLNVFFGFANPKFRSEGGGLSSVSAVQELNEVSSAIVRSFSPKSVKIAPAELDSLKTFQTRLKADRFSILHYVGHAENGHFIWGRGGAVSAVQIPASEVASISALQGVRLAILSCCNGDFLAAEFLKQGISCIFTHGTVTNEVAQYFCGKFYLFWVNGQNTISAAVAGATSETRKQFNLSELAFYALLPMSGPNLALPLGGRDGQIADVRLSIRPLNACVYLSNSPVPQRVTGGIARFSAPPGSNLIRVEADGYQPAELELHFAGGETTERSFELEPETRRLQVATWPRVSGAKVCLRPRGSTQTGERFCEETNQEGLTQFSGLKLGEYAVSLELPVRAHEDILKLDRTCTEITVEPRVDNFYQVSALFGAWWRAKSISSTLVQILFVFIICGATLFCIYFYFRGDGQSKYTGMIYISGATGTTIGGIEGEKQHFDGQVYDVISIIRNNNATDAFFLIGDEPGEETWTSPFYVDPYEISVKDYLRFYDEYSIPAPSDPDVYKEKANRIKKWFEQSIPALVRREHSPVIPDEPAEALSMLIKYITPKFDATQRMTPDLPIVHIAPVGLDIYCRSRGGHLITERQFHATYRGPEDRVVPWSLQRLVPFNGLSGSSLNRLASPDELHKKFPDSKSADGVWALAGNANEWVRIEHGTYEGRFGVVGGSYTARVFGEILPQGFAAIKAVGDNNSANTSGRCAYDAPPQTGEYVKIDLKRSPYGGHKGEIFTLMRGYFREDNAFGKALVGRTAPKRRDVSAFWIDSKEVSVAKYADFFSKIEQNFDYTLQFQDNFFPKNDEPAKLLRPNNWGEQLENRDLPVTGVNFWSASLYCRAQNKRLPSADEFEYIVRLIHIENDIEEKKHNINYRKDGTQIQLESVYKNEQYNGIYNLLGNAAEWVAEPENRQEKAAYLRGGDANSKLDYLILPYFEISKRKDDLPPFSGFRCASN